MRFEQIFCDSIDALNFFMKNSLEKNVLIKTSSPNILLNPRYKNICHLENKIIGEKLKKFQKSIHPFTKEVFETLKKTSNARISSIASNQATFFQRLLRKVVCLEKKDNEKKTLIIKLETGNKELNELVNTQWEEVLVKKNFYYKTFDVEHFGIKNYKIFRPSILDHINLNSFDTNFFFFYKRLKSLISSKKKNGIFLIFREDHLLREISSHLLRKGIQLKFFENPEIPIKPFSNNRFKEIRDILYPVISSHCMKWVEEEYLKNIVEFFFRKLKYDLDQYNSYSIFFEKYLDRIDQELLCATSYPGLTKYIALSHQLKKKKIKLISTQHGINREINSYYSEGLTFLENNFADLLFLNNIEGKRVSDRSPFAFGKTKVIGTPKQMSSKKKIKSISSFFNKQIFYVSTRTSSANYNMLNGFQTDYERVLEEIDLVENIFGKLKKKIYYKAYPYMNYYVDRDPVHEKIDEIENIKLIYNSKDLHNYFDQISLIITSRATSTLSWCILSDIPVIFIDHDKEFRLKDSARNIFKESIIFFDKNKKSFNKDLFDYLSKPMSLIKRDWNNKASKRENLIEKYISTQQGQAAGKIAASYLLNNRYFKKVKKCAE